MRILHSSGSFTLGLFICIGLLGASLLAGQALRNFKAADRSVTVKGLAEREVAADLVIWPVSFTETGNDLSALYLAINNKQETILRFLTDNRISTKEISTNPPDLTDFHAQKYSNNQQKREFRYLARATLTVRSEDVDQVRQLMAKSAELIKQDIVLSGEEYQTRPEYLFTSLNVIKPEMIQEATEDARRAAEQFARDSGSEVGSIKNARQGFFAVRDRDRNTPYRKVIRVVTTVDYFLKDS